MKGLLENKANRDDIKIYQVWFEAVRGQYTQANERLYLKQKQDTAAFFDLNYRMFTILETLDSLDMRPDKKGKVNLQYRQKNAELLNAYRPNIFNGGTYHLRKKEYEKAYKYYEFYIDCDRQPLFTGRNYTETDTRMAEAAYWATYSGYLMRDPVLTLRHRELALRDTSKAQYTLQYVAEARRWLNDQELYIAALEEGFRRFPTASYFFPRLMDAYTQENKLERALAIADSALSVCEQCDLYLFAKSTTLLRMEKYEECIKISDELIARNDTMAQAYFNAGTAYLNLALLLDPYKQKKQVQQRYSEARPYMERCRALMPDEKEKWGPALYRIYLNLNLGRQFDEIDRLLK
jgi:tetratricopeptide (TPR) repeat protein